MSQITIEMLTATIPLLRRDRIGTVMVETGISIEEVRWDDPRVLSGPAESIGIWKEEAPTAFISDSWTRGGFLVRTIGVFAVDEAWIIVLGDDIAGLTGYITRLEPVIGQTTTAFQKAWFTRMSEISFENVSHYY